MDDVAARLAKVKAQIDYKPPTPAQKAWRYVAALSALVTHSRGTQAILRAQSEAFTSVIRAATGQRSCICGHGPGEHSQQLAGGPCLACDCPGMMAAQGTCGDS